jgi:spermidine synthase
LYGIVFITGVLVGLEIPLLMNILKNNIEFKSLVSRVFTFDYLGALIASLIFPLLFVPKLGLQKTALFFGILNVVTGIAISFLLDKQLKKPALLKLTGFVCLLLLVGIFALSDRLTSNIESRAYPGKVIFAKSSPYQRIVITRNHNDIRLFLNNNLQFSTIDEHRYHEALVHPAMQKANQIKNILILGGGDGIAAREVLKYTEVESIDLVDLDPAMTHFFSTHTILKEINKEALLSKKVTVYNADAFVWVKNSQKKYDVAIIDFPDPSNYSLGKLYTATFYGYLRNILNDSAVVVVQSTSPFVAKNSFWCVNQTMQSVGFNTTPYYNNVPSFGIWGYIMGTPKSELITQRTLPPDLRFYSDSMMTTMQLFPKDMRPSHTPEINRLNNQSLVHYFEREWGQYLQN